MVSRSEKRHHAHRNEESELKPIFISIKRCTYAPDMTSIRRNEKEVMQIRLRPIAFENAALRETETKKKALSAH